MMSLCLAHRCFIAPINILLKSFETSGSSRSILSTLSDSEITSGRINLERNANTKENETIYELMVPRLAERY